MSRDTILVELILAGFFAVACIRTIVPAAPQDKFDLGDLAPRSRTIEEVTPVAMAVVFHGGAAACDSTAKGRAAGPRDDSRHAVHRFHGAADPDLSQK